MIKIIFLATLSWWNPSWPDDSLRTESIDGKLFIIHQVDEHETLYGISRRYAVSVASILEFNAKADGGLEVGQLLKIPYLPRNKKVTPEGIVHRVAPRETLFSISRLYSVSVDDIKTWNNLTDNALSVGQELTIRKKTTVAAVKDDWSKSIRGRHTVAPKETLFSIAKKYSVSTGQLKEWNPGQGDEVKAGDILWVVPPTVTQNVVKATEPKPVEKEDVKLPVTDKVITISENLRGSDEVKEGGLAELIEGSDGNRKYLALHRSAKIGTIMKVRNELNNREVFVRVVGSLPDTGVNDKVVIKISKSAYDRLGAIDPKFRAEVTYYK